MATHDYVIDNSTGANVRADINNVLQAILTNNSSSSAPSTTAAYMWWADTTNGVLKIRNSSNNAWVELLQLDGTLTLEDGSVSAPALAFRDDLDTGIFSSAQNTINFATAGVERMELGTSLTVFNEDGADVDFRVESDTQTHAIFLQASNSRVGINKSVPTSPLHVHGGSDNTILQIESTDAGAFMTAIDNSGAGSFGQQGASTVITCDAGGSVSSSVIVFQIDSNTERARLTTTDFLVGKTVTSTATTGVRIAAQGSISCAQSSTSTNFGTSGGANVVLCNNNATDNNFTSIGGYKSDGLVTSQINFVNVSHSSRHGSLAFMTHNGSSLGQRMLIDQDGQLLLGASGPASRINPTDSGVLHIEADPGNNYGSSRIQLKVDNAEIMRIVAGTNPFVAIGRTAQQGSEGLTVDRNGQDVVFFTQNSAGNYKTLRLLNKRATSSTTGRQIEFLDESGNTRGSIENNTSTTTYNTSSDYRLKENEVEISDGIDRIKQLKPYRFNWKNRPHITVDGFFAHEVENIVEDCVLGEKDKIVNQEDIDKGDFPDNNIGDPIYQQMDHSKLVPLLVAAVKQLITKVETLEAA